MIGHLIAIAGVATVATVAYAWSRYLDHLDPRP
jgi:hypothetical protein